MVCPKCGTVYEGNYCPKGCNSPYHKPKKPIYKKWWFWLIVAIVVIAIVGGSSASEEGASNNTDATSSVSSTSVEKVTKQPTTKPETVKPTESPAQIEKKFKKSCGTIDFKTLSRNPDKYKGNNYKFTGEVIQVQEGWFNTVDLRINITKEELEYIDEVMWTDTIYATVEIPDGADNILEEDIITIWGTCNGEYTYESVLGSSVTLPKINVEYYELVSK